MAMAKQHTLIDPERYGVSFSVKQCRNFGVEPQDCLRWLLGRGWRRFRLMSYWNEHEKTAGQYDFSELDWQLQMIEKKGGRVSLCVGVKQPRWPEYHWPGWTNALSEPEKTAALLAYIEVVVKRYRAHPAVVSYQLENEALLADFGENIEINRSRLRREFELVKRLDPHKPVAMSTSTSWGLPFRRPIPDMVGFSFYKTLFDSKKQRYGMAFHSPLLDRLRAFLLQLFYGRQSFIHELQCEPWGPRAIWEMPVAEQNRSMSPTHIRKNIAWAQSVRAYPIDLWGGEWWYWRWQRGDKTIDEAVAAMLRP